MEIYAGFLEHTDVQYGKIVEKLQLQGLLDNNLIIYIHDYLDREKIIWNYATTQWLQLVIPNNKDSNPSRWPVHPAWEEISRARLFDSTQTLKRVTKKRIPNDQYLFVNGLGIFSSFILNNSVGS